MPGRREQKTFQRISGSNAARRGSASEGPVISTSIYIENSNFIDQLENKKVSQKNARRLVDFAILPQLGVLSKCKFASFPRCKMIGALGCRKTRRKFLTSTFKNWNPCI
jgi:hypothetical protein